MEAVIGVLTVSDRASKGEYEDLSGKAIMEYLKEVIRTPYRVEYRIVPDDREFIERALREMVDEAGCSLILTTGGTGPAPRDVTPEATEAVCDKILPGFGELMRRVSLEQVPTAILSRQTAGVRGAVFPAIPYCIDLIGGAFIDTYEEKIRAFRPGR